jgi:type VI secretion system protein ImpF
MPRPADASVTQPLLERLIDTEPKTPSEQALTRPQSVRKLKAALRRDLEWLLNSRRTPIEADESCPELQKSLYHFGLPDLTNLSMTSAQDQDRLTWLLEKTIQTFEPRLDGVRVSMQPLTDANRRVQFIIEGLLLMDPAPERISFDTMLDLTSGSYKVEGESGA